MKTLVVHPEDPTTDFLKDIYKGLSFTIVNDELSEPDLLNKISSHDRVIFLGHGSNLGLLGWDRLVFHSDMVYALKNSPLNIFIWCHASEFVRDYKLTGFYTGMFISELMEALFYGIVTNDKKINYSNKLFAGTLRSLICNYLHPKFLYLHLKDNYTSNSCPVIKFNQERLYYSTK